MIDQESYAPLSSFESHQGSTKKKKKHKNDPEKRGGLLSQQLLMKTKPKKRNKIYIMRREYIEIVVFILCLAPSCLPFWTQWKRRKERQSYIVLLMSHLRKEFGFTKGR
ncbi:hypothetical protein AAZV13_04G080850 [Glycine max]